MYGAPCGAPHQLGRGEYTHKRARRGARGLRRPSMNQKNMKRNAPRLELLTPCTGSKEGSVQTDLPNTASNTDSVRRRREKISLFLRTNSIKTRAKCVPSRPCAYPRSCSAHTHRTAEQPAQHTWARNAKTTPKSRTQKQPLPNASPVPCKKKQTHRPECAAQPWVHVASARPTVEWSSSARKVEMQRWQYGGTAA